MIHSVCNSSDFTLPKLYGLSSTGKVKEWEIGVLWFLRHPCIVTTFGYADGKKQVTKELIKEGKNLGRSNATTPWEQACLEARSKWARKKDDNYAEEIPTSESIALLPMLAQKYKDKKHLVKWPWYGQPKLNGVRALSCVSQSGVSFLSRKSKQFTTVDHIGEELLRVFPANSILDGELFHPQLSLQDIVSRVKRQKTSRVLLDDIKLQYWIYDVVTDEMTFKERINWLRKFFNQGSNSSCSLDYVQLVDTRLLGRELDLITYNKCNLEAGFEGTILRNPQGLYKKDYRSSDLLKYKDLTFQDDEFEIVGGESATGQDEGTVVFICKTKQGRLFRVRPKGSRALRRYWLDHIEELRGKLLTVRYAELTADDIPFHPSGIIIRDYE